MRKQAMIRIQDLKKINEYENLLVLENGVKINIDDIEEEDKKAKESEEIINKLLQEQEELIRDNQKK